VKPTIPPDTLQAQIVQRINGGHERPGSGDERQPLAEPASLVRR
jgi:hypothetical protein